VCVLVDISNHVRLLAFSTTIAAPCAHALAVALMRGVQALHPHLSHRLVCVLVGILNHVRTLLFFMTVTAPCAHTLAVAIMQGMYV